MNTGNELLVYANSKYDEGVKPFWFGAGAVSEMETHAPFLLNGVVFIIRVKKLYNE